MLSPKLHDLQQTLVNKFEDRTDEDQETLKELNVVSDLLRLFNLLRAEGQLEMYGGPVSACSKCLRPFN